MPRPLVLVVLLLTLTVVPAETAPAVATDTVSGPSAERDDDVAFSAGTGNTQPEAVVAAAEQMSFDAGPEPVARGGTVTLSGRAWRHPTGNSGRITFFFQRYGTLGFRRAAHTTADDAGRFRTRVPARATGTWKAVRTWAPTRDGARLDAVQVIGRQPRQLAAYRGELMAWQGPRLRIPSARYRAVASYRCAADGYLSLHWNGGANGFEHATSNRPSGAVTLSGHEGARSGYFEVSTWSDCSWTVRVFSGSVLVQV